MTSQQLHQARAAHWHQNAAPILTFEDASSWVQQNGFLLFLPRRQQLPAPAPSFVEACMGELSHTPARSAIETALELAKRLFATEDFFPLNLLGTLSEEPDFLVSREHLPWILSLRGDRTWKTVPSGRVSPLNVGIWKLLDEQGELTVRELREGLGREVTDAAVRRALVDLWSALRVFPRYREDDTLWTLVKSKYAKECNNGANTAQGSALSILIAGYLRSVIAVGDDDIATFLSPLASRSRVREVLHGLTATRQLETVVLGPTTLLYVAGELPEFPEIVPAASETEDLDETGDEAAASGEDAAPRPARRDSDSGFERKRAYGSDRSDRPARPYGDNRPARGDRPSRPYGGDRDRPSYGRPGYERSGSGDDRRPSRPYQDRPYQDRPAAGSDRPARPYGGDRGGFKPRREGGFQPREGGPRREGGFKPRGEGGFAPRREGGFKPRGEGGFAPRREGGFKPRGEGRPFGDRREGGFRPPFRKAGGPGFGDRKREEGENFSAQDRPARAEGGFKPRGEGGFKPRREGGFKPRGEGGFKPREGGFKPRREGGFAPRREGGFKPRGEGGFKPRGEGGFKPRGEGGFKPRGEGGFKPRGEGGFKPREEGSERPRRSFSGDRPAGKSFGGPKKSFGGPKKSFGGPKKSFGGPKKSFGGPKKSFGGPKKFGKGPGKPKRRPDEE